MVNARLLADLRGGVGGVGVGVRRKGGSNQAAKTGSVREILWGKGVGAGIWQACRQRREAMSPDRGVEYAGGCCSGSLVQLLLFPLLHTRRLAQPCGFQLAPFGAGQSCHQVHVQAHQSTLLPIGKTCRQ